MSNFYTGQTFYGAVRARRKVFVFKLIGHDELNDILYLRSVETGKAYKVSRYYLGKTLFLSEDNARAVAGLRRKQYYEKSQSPRKKPEYPMRMYERFGKDPSYRPNEGYLEHAMRMTPLQKEDDWSKYDK